LTMAAQRLRKHGFAKFTGVLGKAEKLPFADGSFDVVLFVTVLGEIPDRAVAIREASRVLRPGGLISSTEAAGDPDQVTSTEMDALAALAGLEKRENWLGLLIKTFNYGKPVSGNDA